jgi:predicted ATPase
VIVGQHIDPTQVLASVTQLVGKSLLNVEVGDEEVFYRLLDTTRHYALEKLELSGEREILRERHAERYLTLMEQAQTEWEHTPTTQWIERYARGLEDLRAASTGFARQRLAPPRHPFDRDVGRVVAGAVIAQGIWRACPSGVDPARKRGPSPVRACISLATGTRQRLLSHLRRFAGNH